MAFPINSISPRAVKKNVGKTCLLAACGHGRYMIEQWARSKAPRVEFREGVR
jgi:hypothetical protein